MAHKEFFQDINDRSRLRVLIGTERGKVRRFMVQLETWIGETWIPVARYDTAHGFAHLDILHPKGRQDKLRMQATNFDEALENAFADLLANRQEYIDRYFEEI